MKNNLILLFYSAYTTPFILGVSFDNNEICTQESSHPGDNTSECEGIVGSNEAATTAEAGLGESGAGGHLGFSLCYVQHTPPI